jgi:hypothetical protein
LVRHDVKPPGVLAWQGEECRIFSAAEGTTPRLISNGVVRPRSNAAMLTNEHDMRDMTIVSGSDEVKKITVGAKLVIE